MPSWKKVLESDLNNLVAELKEVIRPPAVIIIEGPLGAGKTTLVKKFIGEEMATTSPTYSLINELENILHADLYRIENSEDLIHLEIPIYLENKDYLLIEWGYKYFSFLKRIIGDEYSYYLLTIHPTSDIQREIILETI